MITDITELRAASESHTFGPDPSLSNIVNQKNYNTSVGETVFFSFQRAPTIFYYGTYQSLFNGMR